MVEVEQKTIFVICFYDGDRFLGYSQRDTFMWIEYAENAQFFETEEDALRRVKSLQQVWKERTLVVKRFLEMGEWVV